MNSSDSVKESKIINLFNKIKLNKKFQVIIVIVISLIIVFGLITSNKEVDKTNEVAVDEISSYVTNLERRLTNTLKTVDGAGNVSVVITVESGMETVLAMTTTTKQTVGGTETVETPLIVNGKTVIVKEVYPKIVGVLIVAQGAKNIAVLNKIQQATTSLLNINLNQIEILTMK
ncbi:MAG: hypothetical protein IKB67_01015 [Clostridia bacterium]|nr:hypothetical protein [Clostridia bacterium]